MKKNIFLFGLFICFTLSIQGQTLIKANVWYQLENGNNKGKIANNGNKKTGAVMVVKQIVGTGGHWKFVSQGNGLYRLLNRDSKMFLASYGKTRKGSSIRQTNTPGSGALWRVIKLQDGRIIIQNNASLLFVGTAGTLSKTSLIQSGALSARITWQPIEVKQRINSNTSSGNAWPKNTNTAAFKARRGGTIAKAIVRYGDQIQIVGEKPRVGQRIYFFPQRLNPRNTEGLSFDPQKPSICKQTFVVQKVLPRIVLNKPMPNMRNRVNDTFMFIVEIY